jgi:fructokinase
LFQNGINAENLSDVPAEQMEEFLKFSNKFCGLSVQKSGAIASYPTMEEMK